MQSLDKRPQQIISGFRLNFEEKIKPDVGIMPCLYSRCPEQSAGFLKNAHKFYQRSLVVFFFFGLSNDISTKIIG